MGWFQKRRDKHADDVAVGIAALDAFGAAAPTAESVTSRLANDGDELASRVSTGDATAKELGAWQGVAREVLNQWSALDPDGFDAYAASQPDSEGRLIRSMRSRGAGRPILSEGARHYEWSALALSEEARFLGVIDESEAWWEIHYVASLCASYVVPHFLRSGADARDWRPLGAPSPSTYDDLCLSARWVSTVRVARLLSGAQSVDDRDKAFEEAVVQQAVALFGTTSDSAAAAEYLLAAMDDTDPERLLAAQAEYPQSGVYVFADGVLEPGAILGCLRRPLRAEDDLRFDNIGDIDIVTLPIEVFGRVRPLCDLIDGAAAHILTQIHSYGSFADYFDDNYLRND